jgi:hypothetical protein
MLAKSTVSINGFLALKFWVSGGWLIAWNSLFIVAKQLGLPRNQMQGQLLLGGVLLSTGLLALCVVLFPKFRQLLVSKRRSHLYKPSPFLLVSAVAFLLGLFALIDTYLIAHGIFIPKKTGRW